ncbi:YggS family pyridoxal phosphate-dependent enzyme [Candidatus Woesearchaeota archaeon]|nr:YggS family pyridoxal phosphate-dependent enzyme [Candidatus Woesearchaeota archaeon]
MSIKQNVESVNERIKKAAESAGKNYEDIKLLVATKYADVEQIKELIGSGIKVIGENRVQEADNKFQQLPDVEKHMIGHLQSNKAKLAVKIFDVIQTIDSLKIAKEVNKRAFEINKIMPVFIEVNVSGEESKYGINAEEVSDFYNKLVKLTNLKVDGLMTIAPLAEAEESRICFKKLKQINNELGLKYLSMGMSNDFEVAIEEGSNLLRLGRIFFR